jgi:hypothetical protein
MSNETTLKSSAKNGLSQADSSKQEVSTTTSEAEQKTATKSTGNTATAIKMPVRKTETTKPMTKTASKPSTPRSSASKTKPSEAEHIADKVNTMPRNRVWPD